MRRVFAIAILLVGGLAPAHAASPDAWSKFQADVGKACVTASKGLIENGKALVDPFGSQRFGLAVVSGKAVGAKVTISTICVYDKQTKAAEIGGEFAAEKLLVKGGK